MMTVDIEAARRVLPEARELADELGEEALRGWAMFFFGLTETLGGEFDSAQPHLEECRALYHRLGVRVGEGVASAALGLGAAMKGDTDGGQELLEDGGCRVNLGWWPGRRAVGAGGAIVGRAG